MKRATSMVLLVLSFIVLICCAGSSVMAQNSKKSVSDLTDEELLAEINRIQRKHFFKAKSFKCTFENGYFARWENGHLESKVLKENLTLIFDSINLKNKTARLIGNQGTSDISANKTFGGITFVEITSVGSFITTTIYIPTKLVDKDVTAFVFLAVHSRHIVPFLGEPLSSQYYGKCKIWDVNR